MKHVVIVGSGVGGLGLACLLGKKGFQVTVCEKNEQLGGRASSFEANGFRFDMGPSWYLMPDVFEHFFELLGERIDHHLTLAKLKPSYRIHFKGTGRKADFYSDYARDRKTVERLEPGASRVLSEYLGKAKTQYEIAIGSFMYKNYDSVRDLLDLETIRQGAKLRVMTSMDRYVKRYFKSDEMRKVMQYHLAFLGSPPSETPALYNILSHVDFHQGVFYPKGGINRLIQALVGLGKSYGVAYRLDCEVKHIRTALGKASGVALANGEVIDADIVVSNADLHHTEKSLLDPADRTYSNRYWPKRSLAPSALILYLGVKGKIPQAVHHNLFFSSNWNHNFQQLFDNPGLPDDPSFYVCAPSVTDDTVAPPGMENLFVLVPIGSRTEYSQESLEKYAEGVLQVLETEIGVPDLRQRIIYRRMFSAEDFSSRYNSYGGSALGLSHTLRQSAVWRPSNISKKVSNLYYVGAGTNPGIGLPTCLISAELAYKRIIQNRSSAPLPTL